MQDDVTRAPWRGRAILHVDLDAFFAAVEQLDHPEWRGRPVIVGGRGARSVVSTCSYEARAFGVRSAMPSVQAERLCPDAIWVRPRFDRYRAISRSVRDVLFAVTPRVEPTSIDEAYLDVTPGRTGEHPVTVARRIQRSIDALGLSCSIGVAACKVVAKVASDHDKPHGLTVVRPGTEAAFLAPLALQALPGIGPRSADRLASLGIRTIGGLASLDLATARRLLGSSGVALVERARGHDDRVVEVSSEVKSVSNERTYETDVRDLPEARRALAMLCEKVAVRLRAKRLAGRTVTVKVRYADFTTRTARRTLDEPTDLERVIEPVAYMLLERLWVPTAGVRLLGVGVSGLSEPHHQLSLTESPDDERERRLMSGLDAVRERFGDGAIRRGGELMRGEDPRITDRLPR